MLDPDVTLFFDPSNRISEILIERASERLDLARLHGNPSFSVDEVAEVETGR